MLYVSKSYDQLKKYGGNDHQTLKMQIYQNINDVLIQSNVPCWLIPSLREEIM